MNILKRMLLTVTLIVALFACFTMQVSAAEIEDESATNVTETESKKVSVSEYLAELRSNIDRWNNMKIISLNWNEISEVPLFFQSGYTTTPYGEYGTIASHGCGIVCLSMVSTYLTDTVHNPVDLAEQFGSYNTEKGSQWILFEDSAKALGLSLQERTYSEEKVVEALKNGQVVIALQGRGRFTNGGHFIVLTGINEDGKITVNDPNRNNYSKNEELIDGFKNGFTEEQVFEFGGPYWIYNKKTIENANLLGSIFMFDTTFIQFAK